MGKMFSGIFIEGFEETDIYLKQIEIILIATYTAQKAIEEILVPYKALVEIIKLYDM